MFAQVHSRALNVLLSFKTQLPFDRLPVWSEIRELPLEEQAAKFRDPVIREQLVQRQWQRTRRRHRRGGTPSGLRLGVRAGQCHRTEPDGG